jgi:hypothetical protein
VKEQIKESEVPKNNEELSKAQEELRSLLLSTPTVEKVTPLLSKISDLKHSSVSQSSLKNGEFVQNLEYQKSLATKFAQTLVSLYKSDPELFSKSLTEYDLEEIIYDLFVNYILNDSQSSKDFAQNDIWTLINFVLMPAVKDQQAVNRLVIKVLSNFISTTSGVHSKARVIQSLEHLPYSYEKILLHAYENLYQDPSKIKVFDGIQDIFESFNQPTTVSNPEDDSVHKLLLTVLVLNNLKEPTTDAEKQIITETLETTYKIAEWVIQNITFNPQMKKFILNMVLDLLVYLLKLTGIENLSKLASSQSKFLRNLTMTTFFMDQKDLSQKLSQIFEMLVSTNNLKTNEEAQALKDEPLAAYKLMMQETLLIFENSFKFWENSTNTLLSDPVVNKEYSHKQSWVTNLIFCLDFYLTSYDKLTSLITHIRVNNSVLEIDNEILDISLARPDFKVVENLV